MTAFVDADGFLVVCEEAVVDLHGPDGEVEARHVIDREAIQALNAALAARRPLLVRGEPGTGKSQLARAAAELLGRALVPFTVDALTEPRDLLYRVDDVARLAEAQIQSASPGTGGARAAVAVANFLSPGPLWWAFEWISASEQQSVGNGDCRPIRPAGDWDDGKGCVVLIDEIDKADASVPNGLLDALGHGRFDVRGHRPIRQAGAPPLVIITTNEERALPDAFLRRCLVLQLGLPTDEKTLTRLLVRRGGAHFPQADAQVLSEAAAMVVADRAVVKTRGLLPPGLAEYIDLLRVVQRPGSSVPQQLSLLAEVRRFALDKHPQS